jgi:hypothetical protein
MPLPSQISVVGLGHAVWRNAVAPAFFFRPLLCRTASILIHSFLALLVPTSRFRALVLAQMTDGSPRSTSFNLCLRSALSSPRHLLRPCHSFFPIPFDNVDICANLASTSRDSLQSSILMPNILSQSTLSPAKNAFPSLPVSFDFSEFKGFESSPTSKIRPGICPSILSPL